MRHRFAALGMLSLAACAAPASSSIEGGPADAAAATTDAAATDAGFTPAPHRVDPMLVQGAGDVLHDLRLVTVVSAGDPLSSSLVGFGDALVASAWYHAIGDEYGVGPAASSLHLTGPALTTPSIALDRAAVERYLQRALTGAPALAPDGHTVYVLYLPSGVDLAGDESCKGGADGHHAAFGDLGDAFAVVPRCPAPFASALEQATLIASHEVAEAVTDTPDGFHLARPAPTPGWRFLATPWLAYNGPANAYQPNVENGDLCNLTRVVEGGFAFQRSFSNRAAAAGGDPCVPALSTPYYSTTTGDDWYPAVAGTSVIIPVTGWSTGATDDWIVSARPLTTSAPGFVAHIESDTTTAIAGKTYKTINDGRVVSLVVAVPASAASGAWATIYLTSRRLADDGSGGPGGDDYGHHWVVGVHVP